MDKFVLVTSNVIMKAEQNSHCGL